MKVMQKRVIAVICICILLIAGAAVVSKNSTYEKIQSTEIASEASPEQENSAFAEAPADVTFWYSDDSYQSFFEKTAEEYYNDTGIRVAVSFHESMDYLGDVYQATIQNDNFPDVYLITGDQLEASYLYGLAARNTAADIYQSTVAANAVKASAYNDIMYGYPLSYDTCLFVYQNGYFENQPASIQAIIDYAEENDPPENVEYLLEWDVNDPFYDFPIISNSVSFEKESAESLAVSYNDALYEEDLTFFQDILESFSIDADAVSEQSVIDDFLNGKTLCAILNSNSLKALEGYDYSMMEFPALNDTLEAKSAGLTDLVMVNDFSEQKEEAGAFAEYVTLTMSEEIYSLCGHYSVKLSENADDTEKMAYQVYENSVLVPDSQDAKDFWVTLKETISQYF